MEDGAAIIVGAKDEDDVRSILTRKSFCTGKVGFLSKDVSYGIMIITQRIPIIQSRRLSRKIAKCVRECDIVYDMSILMKMAHPGLSQYDLNYMTPGWREQFCLTGASLMHEAASKQARLAVIAFRDSNRSKHDRRIRLKKGLKAGRITRYRRNRWTDPSSLLRGGRTPALLHSLTSRGTPKMRDPSTVFLPGLGNVRLKERIHKGEPRSFQMVDCTRKVTCRTTDADRRFILHVQMEVPDPRPAAGNQAGMDLGVRRLAAIADECGNETLHNVAGGCRRHDGDKVDKMRSERTNSKKGSRSWRNLGRKIRKELRKISNRQHHEEIRVARQVASGKSMIFMEGWDLTKARAAGGSAKTGLNREMAYSRMGSFRDQVRWQMKKAGGSTALVDKRNTSLTCARCGRIDKKSRNGESFHCTACGWHHHADKNAARNILTKGRLHVEAGGQPRDTGGAIAGTEVVMRREDHRPGSPVVDALAGRLGPGNDGNYGSAGASESASVGAG